MLAIILLTATVGLPIGCLYLYHRFVLRTQYEFQKNDFFVPLGAAVLQFCASTIPYLFLNTTPANFLHHAIGGGVAVSIIALYFQSRVWPGQHWFVKGLFVFAVVNILGNANEVLELVAELLTGFAYIANKLDTNIDIVANNVGAGVGFFLALALNRIRNTK
jgi:hypothetical protein